jgi:hypothetical protein
MFRGTLKEDDCGPLSIQYSLGKTLNGMTLGLNSTVFRLRFRRKCRLSKNYRIEECMGSGNARTKKEKPEIN